jgi:hypothetical protein
MLLSSENIWRVPLVPEMTKKRKYRTALAIFLINTSRQQTNGLLPEMALGHTLPLLLLGQKLG